MALRSLSPLFRCKPSALLQSAAQVTAVMHRGFQHHAALHRKLIVHQSPPQIRTAQQGRVMGQESQMAAHVEAQDRHLMNGEVPCRAQHRAITTKHHRKVGKFWLRCQ